jgi:hypothetical protein
MHLESSGSESDEGRIDSGLCEATGRPSTIPAASGARRASGFAIENTFGSLAVPQVPVAIIAALLCHALLAPVASGQPTITEQLVLSGAVEGVAGGRVTIRDESGSRHEVRVQKAGEQGVPLADGRLLAFPAEVRITGPVDPAKLKPGQIVRFRTQLSSRGVADGELAELALVDAADAAIGVAWPHGPPAGANKAEGVVTASVLRASRTRLAVELPASQPFPKKTVIFCSLADGIRASLESHDLKRLEPAATISRLEAVRLDTGDVVAKLLVADNPAAKAVTPKGDDVLENKYRSLSDKPPAAPRLVRSPHFAFITDIPDREWAVLRDKLERMVELLEQFFGRKSTGVVEGFIVRDLGVWPAGSLEEPAGVEKIRHREGVCFNSTLGGQRRACLYSCDDHGVIQHECVHGFCHMTFGSTGPTWLSEGVAELGNSWREGDTAVDIDPRVMGYLQNARPRRRLGEIAVPGRSAAGSWQDYAWRWALCHLLAYNPNYADRFRPLAVALMEERPDASFETTYGPVADQVAFEYDRFLESVGNGYRADLTAWPWTARFRPLASGSSLTAKAKARAGWQASGLAVEKGISYDVQAQGTWRTAPAGAACDADGDTDGRGRLVAVVFHDFTLTQAIPLGSETTFSAPVAGQLFLRCDDDWTQLSDNEGELAVTFSRP